MKVEFEDCSLRLYMAAKTFTTASVEIIDQVTYADPVQTDKRP